MGALTVPTTAGLVEGTLDRGTPVWRGVPYGEPTGGERRFRPSRPVSNWDGVRPADRFGSMSWQLPMTDQPMAIRIVDPNDVESEDCLCLNVWSPAADDHRRPVLVWLHPSGHVLGSGNSPHGQPRVYAAQHDCVVVTANYRLGLWGHLYFGELDPDFADSGNQIVRDQILLLEWIRDNIAVFGGDPGNVTLFGESGGGFNVGTLLGVPSARELVHRAAIYSGGATHPVEPAVATEQARRFLAAVGPSTKPADLIGMSNVRLRYAHKQLIIDGPILYSAFIDGDLIPRPPLETIAAGAITHLPLLVSNTADEATMWNVLSENGVADAIAAQSEASPEFAELVRQYRAHPEPDRDPDVDLLSDTIFFGDTAKLLAAHEQGGGTAWFEMFDYLPSTFPRQDVGAMHGADIWMLLHDPEFVAPPGPEPLPEPSPDDHRVADLEQQALVSLARDGVPSVDGVQRWRPHTGDDRQMVRLSPAPAAQVWEPRPAALGAVLATH